VAFVTQPILDRRTALPRRSAAKLGQPVDLDPDGELVLRWRAGDARAFEILVRRHERRVLGLLVRMLGNREDAQDAAQETFLNLHRHGHRFRRESRFSTFVYRVAVNAALNRRRTLGRRRAHMERLTEHQAAGHDVPSTPRGPEDAASGEEVRDRVSQGILTLTPALRAPLVLYDIEGLAYGEIARVLGLAEGTVKSRIHRARRALRDQLRDLVGEQDAAPEDEK
jgi:RNA polymerase sigma-70 factor, ECF subfamily